MIRRRSVTASLALLALASLPPTTLPAATSQAQESTYVRLLKSGRLPEDRQGTVLDFVGKRGSPADLAYVFHRALEPEGFTPKVRLQALNALADAALTRKAHPDGDLSDLSQLIQPSSTKLDEPTRLAAIRLAGLWHLESAAPALTTLAQDPKATRSLRAAALDALATLGGSERRDAIAKLAAPGQSWEIRAAASAALARIDPEAALKPAVAAIADAEPGRDLVPLLAAFLNRQGGADKLAAALSESHLSPDSAKLALRALYALGRTDASLVAELSKAAGLDADVKAPTESELKALLAEIAEKGDPVRGEDVFRRPDLSCSRCHALAGAGGGVGPDLSAVGSSSPPDYLIHSVLLPDQAIKEQFQTLVVLTTDGQIYQGIVADRDNQRLILKEATGDLRTIPASAIEESREGGSLMPKGLANLMTHQEFVDLIRFLSELGKPGPFAIRTTPTIQRWRVLQDSDPSLTPSQLPDPSSDAWVPVFARVSGSLPLSDAVALSGSPVVFLLGEVDVSVPGRVEFRLDDPEGVTAYLNGEPVSAEGTTFARNFAQGRHTLTLRIDTDAPQVTRREGRGDSPARAPPPNSPSSAVVEFFSVARRDHTPSSKDSKTACCSRPTGFRACVPILCYN